MSEKFFVLFYFLSDDTHFKTNPKIPGIDLNSVRILFEALSKPAFSGLLEQVCICLCYSLSHLKLKASVKFFFTAEPCCLIKARQQCRKKSSFFEKSKVFKDPALVEKNHLLPFTLKSSYV